MLHLEGERLFSRDRETVSTQLTQLPFLIQCLPDLHEVRDVQERTAAVVLRPGFSFARGEMQLAIEKLEETPPSAAKFSFKTKGIGTSSEVEATFTLTLQDAGTLLRWSLNVQKLGGLLKAVPGGLIQGGAQRVVTELLDKLAQRLAAPSD